MLYWPLRSPSNASSRLPGGTRRSPAARQSPTSPACDAPPARVSEGNTSARPSCSAHRRRHRSQRPRTIGSRNYDSTTTMLQEEACPLTHTCTSRIHGSLVSLLPRLQPGSQVVEDGGVLAVANSYIALRRAYIGLTGQPGQTFFERAFRVDLLHAIRIVPLDGTLAGPTGS